MPDASTAEPRLSRAFNVADHYLLPNLTPDRVSRPYMLCGDETLTYGELHRSANRVAHALARLAGESLPASLYHRWLERFGCEILDGIGSTENLHDFIANRPGRARPGSSGQVVPGYQAKIVDERGIEVEDGEVGALWIRGGSAASHYWNRREKTRETMRGPWLVTGDQYHRNEDGYYWHHGRNDDMKVSGSWVSPVEVESALGTHPAVAECAVVGRMDEEGLTKPHAFVVLRAGHEPMDGQREELVEALRTHVRAAIAGFKAPRWVDFVTELPKTATGKIRRFELREE